MTNPSLLGSEELEGRLRPLYESRGFRRTVPATFEEYSLYTENRNFLDCDHVITFMDMDGNLQALKSDVTLSIVKHIPREELAVQEKVYYLDQVYRSNQESRCYQVVSQIGVELIGREDPFSNLEAVDLALDSLELISPDYLLGLSHLGIVGGLLESLGLTQEARQQVLAVIHAKSPHSLAQVLDQVGLTGEDRGAVLALSELHGPLAQVLPKLKPLCRRPQMEAAWGELEQLSQVLADRGANRCFFDCSVVGDLDYYNGLLFQGYIQGVPRAILTGGRYDRLLRRMGGENTAIGFGINLSAYALYQRREPGPDLDRVLYYQAGCDFPRLLAAQKELAREGARVRLEPHPGAGAPLPFPAAKGYCFTPDNRLEEVPPC